MKVFLFLLNFCVVIAVTTTSYSQNLYLLKDPDTELYGYINKDGHWVITPKYNYAREFSDGLAAIKLDNKWGFINEKGKLIIEPQYEEPVSSFKNGFAIIEPELRSYHFIDKKNHRLKNDICFKIDNKAYHFSENGLAKIKVVCKKRNCPFVYINKKGEVVVKNTFKAAEFSNGLVPVYIKNKYKSKRTGIWQIKYKFGFADSKGEVLINPQFDNVTNFSENGLAAVEINRRWGYMNTHGDMVITPQFYKAEKFVDGLARVLAGLNHDRKWGYINTHGDMVITPRFYMATDFVNGLAVVQAESGRIGYIDKTGKYVIRPQFENAHPFNFNGLAAVRQNNGFTFGLINLKGEWVLKSDSCDFGRFPFFHKNGLMKVQCNRRQGVINSKGVWIVKPIYKYVKIYNDLIFVRFGGAKLVASQSQDYITLKGKHLFYTETEIKNILGDW